MLRRNAEALRVFTFGGDGMQARVKTLYEQWKQVESEVPWEITNLDDLADLPFEDLNERLTEALLNQEADLVIYHMPEGSLVHHGALHLAAITKPDNIMDFLCVRKGEIAEGFSQTLRKIRRIGQLSMRRETQLKRLAPDIEAVEAPRSFSARLKKIQEGAFDAMLISAMQLPPDFNAAKEGLWFLPISVDNILPAVGQGSLGMLTRLTDPELSKRITEVFDHEGARRSFEAERSVLLRLGQNNSSKVTARAEFRDGRIYMRALNAAGGVDYFKYAADYLSYDENYRIRPDRLAAFCDRLLGTVTFMGAGPNDSELMSQIAIERVKEADYLIMDRNVGDHLYRWISCNSFVRYIDREYESILLDHRTSVTLRRETCDKITNGLLKLAREGKTVLRVFSDESLAVGAYEDESSILREEQVPCDWLPSLPSFQKQRIDHAYSPLSGRKVILTRPSPEAPFPVEVSLADEMADYLRSLGAQTLETPLYRTVSDASTQFDVDRDVTRFLTIIQPNNEDREGVVIFSSRRDVSTFFNSLKRLEVDVRSLADVRFLAPNTQVGQRLLDHGVHADYVASWGFSELEDYCEEILTDKSYVLWSHMQPMAEKTFGDADSHVDGYDGVLPPRVHHFDRSLNTYDAHVITIMPYRIERVELCNHRQRHIILNTTDIIFFSPLEVRYFVDMLEKSQLSTPEEFFATHHVYATTAYIARLLRSFGCDKVVELNLGDRDMLFNAFTEIEGIDKRLI